MKTVADRQQALVTSFLN